MHPLDRPAWLCAAMVLVFTGLLTGCAPAQLGERLPGELGLPANAPPRPPATTYQYPEIHDIPPQRRFGPMSEDERQRLEDDLTNARDRQTRRARQKPTDAN